jgi:hypothetical protein
MLLHHPEGGLGAPAQEFGHRCLARLLDADEKAQRGEIAGEFVVVEQDPAQDLELLILVTAAEAPGLLGEISEDRATLAAASASACSSTGISPSSLIASRKASCRVAPPM